MRFAAALYSLPLWIKITVPYLVALIVLFGLLTWLVSQTFSRSLQERFRSQLVDEFVAANDSVFQLETRQLASLRAISRTTGVPDALAASNVIDLDSLIKPLAVNSKLALVHVLDGEGKLLYSLRETANGFVTDDQAEFASWPVVQRVLAGESDSIGDKFVGVVEAPWGTAVYTAGPVKNGQTVLGVVLVGTPLTEMVTEMKGNSLTNVTVYTPQGQSSATTSAGDVVPSLTGDSLSAISSGEARLLQNRIFTLGASEYSEALGALTLRTQPSGWFIGVSLPRSLMTDNQLGAVDVSVWIAIGMAAVVLLTLMGIVVARLVAAPINEVAQAMDLIARGDLEVEVNEYGEDETGQLAQRFNRMARELRLREPAASAPAPVPTITIVAPPMMDSDELLASALSTRAPAGDVTLLPTVVVSAAADGDGLVRVVEDQPREIDGPVVIDAYQEPAAPEPMGPSVTAPVEQDPQPVTTRLVTVLCADIINASSVFADSDPGITSYFLKEYDRIFKELADERGGKITQFGPERSLVVFGIPETVTEAMAARRAMRSAIILWEEVAVMNAQRATRNQPAIDIRITVHTGGAEVNSSGVDDPGEYMVTGEAVQTAEAMQAHARRTDDHILISEPTVIILEDRDEFAVEVCATFGEYSMPLYTILTQKPQFDLE